MNRRRQTLMSQKVASPWPYQPLNNSLITLYYVNIDPRLVDITDYLAYQLRHTLLQQHWQRDLNRRGRSQGTCHSLQLCSQFHYMSHCMPQFQHYCSRTSKEQLGSQLQEDLQSNFTVKLFSDNIIITLVLVFKRYFIKMQQAEEIM